MVGTTRLELATSCPPGMRSSQLSYVPIQDSLECGDYKAALMREPVICISTIEKYPQSVGGTRWTGGAAHLSSRPMMSSRMVAFPVTFASASSKLR